MRICNCCQRLGCIGRLDNNGLIHNVELLALYFRALHENYLYIQNKT